MDKAIEYKCLNFLQRANPDFYKFHLPSWNLPKDEAKLRQAVTNNEHPMYIAKPVDDECGNGIFLFKTMDEYESSVTTPDMVVQKYSDNPHLINNRKYGVRILSLVNGTAP